MGYKRQRKIHVLRFAEDTGDLEGLEVRVYSLSVGQLLDMSRLTDAANRSTEDSERLFTDFAAALISWNLEDEAGLDDEGVSNEPVPVPATLDGVRSCDLDFILRIVKAWMDAIAKVPDPLTSPSGSGPRFPEGSLPMEPLSPNQTS